MSDFRDSYGPWALILGASEGLGEAYAREAAQRGLNVALVARRSNEVRAKAEEIATEFGVETRAITADVGAEDLLQVLEATIGDVTVGLVVYNATAGYIGRFLDQDPDYAQTMVDVNCRGPLRIAFHAGTAMKARGRGGIILMSSGAALAGGPGNAVYAAAKAFDLVLGEGLAREFRTFGVDVLSLIGPAIDTPNFWREKPNVEALLGPPVPAAQVAREAFDQLGKSSSWVAGEKYRQGLAGLGRLSREEQISAMEASVAALYGARSGPEDAES